MDNNGDISILESKEQRINKATPTVTMEKVATATKKAFEQKTANDILTLVQNLDDFEEADSLIMLYVKALNNTLESNKENYRIDENDVIKIIAETDKRFVCREEAYEEYEEE